MDFWSVDSVNCRSKFPHMVGWICWHENWSESERHSVMSDSCNPMDCSPPGSSVYGILQARILEWVAISFSTASSWPRNWIQVCCVAGRFFTNCSLYYAILYRTLGHLWVLLYKVEASGTNLQWILRDDCRVVRYA